MSAGAAAASEARRRAGAPSPRAVTRGDESGAQRAKVDWLNATFAAPSLTPEGFVSLLGRMLGRPVSAAEGGGMLGFESRLDLFAHVGSRRMPLGCIAFGGESQNGRWLLQFPGAGCGLVTDWDGMRALLEDLDAKITRLDLAVDFLDGAWTVDDAERMYLEGRFQPKHAGKAPSSAVAGDWHNGVDGRTLYVGKSKNGKCCRVYEKGKQLGDATSDWVRFEVQLGNRDRVIPFEAITNRDAYFAGAYPALAEVIEAASAVIETVQKGGTVTLAHLMFHLKRCYGKVVDVVAEVSHEKHAELVEEVRISGIPKRLQPSSMAAGLSWSQLLDHIHGRNPALNSEGQS